MTIGIFSGHQPSSTKLPPRIRLVIFLMICTVPTSFLLAVINQPWVNPKWLFLDALAAGELSGDCCHIYYGFVSNLGIFLWISTAAIALFSAFILHLKSADRRFILYALTTGLLSGWLGLDDAFLLHEVAFPKLGIPQTVVMLIYIGLAGLFALFSIRVIFSSDYWILGLAVIGVGLSLGIDTVLHSIDDNIVVLEDSAKFFGLFCWFVYHVATLAMIFTITKTVKTHPPNVE